MENDAVVIKFPGVSDEEANKYAGSLADELSEISGLKAKPARERPETQDFGATLVLVLGTASVTAIALGIKSWLARTGTDAEFYGADGKQVILKNVESKHIPQIAKALSEDVLQLCNRAEGRGR
jgi:hypothetical protein